MKGRATLFWIFLAAAVGFGLFHVKYKVQALEEELARLNHDIIQDQEQLHVLHAEWAYLNRPERLDELNGKFLGLGPLTPDHMAALKDLPMRAADGDEDDDKDGTAAPASFKAPMRKASR